MIQAVNDSLDVKNKELKDLFAQKNTALNEIGVQSKELESEQLKENQYIAQIQKKEKDFQGKNCKPKCKNVRGWLNSWIN